MWDGVRDAAARGAAGDGIEAVRRVGDAAQGVKRRAEYLQPYVFEAAVLRPWAATIGIGAPRRATPASYSVALVSIAPEYLGLATGEVLPQHVE